MPLSFALERWERAISAKHLINVRSCSWCSCNTQDPRHPLCTPRRRTARLDMRIECLDQHPAGPSGSMIPVLCPPLKLGNVREGASRPNVRNFRFPFQRLIGPLTCITYRLHHLGLDKLDLPLPKIVVVGDQSTGKSWLIEGMSEIQVPRSSGCGRCAFGDQSCRHIHRCLELQGLVEEVYVRRHSRASSFTWKGKSKQQNASDLWTLDPPGYRRRGRPKQQNASGLLDLGSSRMPEKGKARSSNTPAASRTLDPPGYRRPTMSVASSGPTHSWRPSSRGRMLGPGQVAH